MLRNRDKNTLCERSDEHCKKANVGQIKTDCNQSI